MSLLTRSLCALLLSLPTFAAPVIESIRTIPPVASPGAKIVVVVQGRNLAAGESTLDLSGIGGNSAPVALTLQGNRLVSAPVDLPAGPGNFDGRNLPIQVTVEDPASVASTANGTVPTGPSLLPPPDLAIEITPRGVGEGSDFAIFVSSGDLTGGTAIADFRPQANSLLNLPLAFLAGRATATAQVPAGAAATVARKMNLLIDIDDLAGNRHRRFETITIGGDPDSASPGPRVTGLTIEPTPLRPGQQFSVSVPVENAAAGVVLIDFRPFAPRIFRLPLVIENGLGTATGTAPASLPAELNDFLRVEALLFSEDRAQRDSVISLIPVTTLPPAPDLSLSITSPSRSLFTRASAVTVSGSAGSGIVSVEINGVTATLGGGTFSASIPLIEGANEINVVGRGANGSFNSTAITVQRDTSAPEINIEVPAENAVLTMPQTTIAGLVNDIVAGTVNSQEVTVTVNGVNAVVTNRSYEVQEFLLARGENLLEIIATDRAGNERRVFRTVFYEDAALQQRILIGAGNNQTGIIGSVLADPLLVEAVDREGVALPNIPLTFTVIRGDGQLTLDDRLERELTVPTNAEGQAEVFFMVGSRTGKGNQRVQVTSPGFRGEVVFCASGEGVVAAQIAALEPTNQIGEYGKLLPMSLQAFITDQGGNPMDNVAVTFTVVDGAGSIYNESEITVFSNASGRATVPLLMGSDETLTSYLVVAHLTASEPLESTSFEGAIVMPGVEAATTISGVVLNSGNAPMPEVEVFVKGAPERYRTDAEGQFQIPNAPVGAITLEVDGNTTTQPGLWPHMEYHLVTIAGQDNSVDRPIYLLPINTASEKLAGGDQDVVLELEGIPGSKLTIFANSLTGPGGEKQLPMRWTQVNRERVPMPPPLGTQFSVVTTVQPPNVHFDPPARIQLPNINGQPGQQIEIFSFDHDLFNYVSIGTATVSDDGAVLTTDPGFGLSKSGWTGGAPPSPPCKPWDGKRPVDTSCEKWTALPRRDRCSHQRYSRKKARIFNVQAKALPAGESTSGGSPRANSITAFVDEDVTFTATAEFEVCPSVNYAWDFGDGLPVKGGSTVTQRFNKEGTIQVQVIVQCFGCPEVRVTQSLTVTVTNDDKIVTMIDSDGRASQGNLLEIVTPPGPGGETITLKARAKEAAADATLMPEWTISGPGGSIQMEMGKQVAFPASFQGSGSSKPQGLAGAPASVYTISCDGRYTQTLKAYSPAKLTFTITGNQINSQVEEITEKAIKGFLSKLGGLKISLAKGVFEFGFVWEECPTNNLAGFTIEAKGSFDPLIGISGEFQIPLKEFGAATGAGIFASAAISVLESLLDFEVGVFLEPSGSITLTGASVKLNACKEVEGSGVAVGGKVGIEIKLKAEQDSIGEIKVFGKTGLTASTTNVDFLNTEAASVEGFSVDFDGISVGIAVVLNEDGIGEVIGETPLLKGSGLETGAEVSWSPVGPVKGIYGPSNFTILKY